MNNGLHKVTLTYDDWGYVLNAIDGYCENPTVRKSLIQDITRIRRNAHSHFQMLTGLFPMGLGFHYLDEAGYVIALRRSDLS